MLLTRSCCLNGYWVYELNILFWWSWRRFRGMLIENSKYNCRSQDIIKGRGSTMNTFSRVPPGFRFHPTDEELVDYYLRKKITSRRIDLDVIKDVDLYKIEPWDLQGTSSSTFSRLNITFWIKRKWIVNYMQCKIWSELCRIGAEDQNEWYFFSHKDKKYPTGTRTNRATTAGFWKATGRDKAIYSKRDLIGMRKTLVFYKGRAPNGQKSDWIMHEYRLETDENGTPQASNHQPSCYVLFFLLFDLPVHIAPWNPQDISEASWLSLHLSSPWTKPDVSIQLYGFWWSQGITITEVLTFG